MTAICIMISICISMAFYNACGIILECINRSKNKDPEISATQIAEITREFRINQCTRLEQQLSEQSMRNKQSIYKVDGDFNGNINGDNVTVILMGDGNINGNIESKDGNVVLIKGNINGDVKANKIVCPTESATEAKCSDCVFAKNKHYISASGIFSEGYYDCSKFNKTVNEDCSACLEFKSRSKNKDVKSPKLQVETLWSCDIPQGTSPQKRIDHYTSIGNHVSIYDSFPVTHIKCPHCKKYFATQVKVRTSVVDGDVVETSVEEIKRDY